MKKNFYLLITGLALFGTTLVSCTKENTPPQSNIKKNAEGSVTTNAAGNTAGQTPSTPASETVSSGGCSHQH
jgi:hypothetical protein